MAERDFDPSYGYSKEQLLKVPAPKEPAGFMDFWKNRYERVTFTTPDCKVTDLNQINNGFRIHEFEFISSQAVPIRGWLLTPEQGPIRRGFILGHGYGGFSEPPTHLPFYDAAIFIPFFRGLGLSAHPNISSQPQWHVLHNIQNYRDYILGYCVEDLWNTVSVMLTQFPEVTGHLGFLGISFSGGLGALALPCEQRIQRAHLNVPTFGNYQVRLQLPTLGSGHSIQCFHKRNPTITENALVFHDAAIAAKHIRIPMHFACALSDAMVAPPGQFAIYNAVTVTKQLFWLKHGHADYPEQQKENEQLLNELVQFFAGL